MQRLINAIKNQKCLQERLNKNKVKVVYGKNIYDPLRHNKALTQIIINFINGRIFSIQTVLCYNAEETV